MAMLESESEDVDPPHPSHLALLRSLQEPSPPQPLSYWGSVKFTAQWYTSKVVRTVTNVQNSVVEPYEIYDSIVRQILTSRLLLPEDRAFVESVLNSETNIAALDERRKWPEVHRSRCLISTLAVFAALLCLRRSSKFQLVSLVTALGVTASKFLSVSMLKLSVLQLTAVQSMQSSLLKWALVQIKDDESFHAQGTQPGPSSALYVAPGSVALSEIETMAREDSQLFARNVFETLQCECLLWQTVSRETRAALLRDDIDMIMPATLDDCKTSCPKLFQPEGLAESTDNFSYNAVQSLKTLNDLHRSECLRNLCLALVQRCHVSLKSVFLCKKALDTVVALQGDKYDFLCREHTELKAKQSSLFTRLNTKYRNGSGKSKYADCDVSVRMLCTNLERCLQLATAIHYEIQEGQEVGSALSLDAINELIEILNGNLTQSVSFSADLQLRLNNKRQQRSGSRLSDSRKASIEMADEQAIAAVDLESIPSGPQHDEVYLGKADDPRGGDAVDRGNRSLDFEHREPSGSSLAPPVLNQLKDVLKAKQAERIEREAAAMKRLGLEELPSSESDNEIDEDDFDGESTPVRRGSSGRPVGHTGFAPSIASQVAAAASGTMRPFGGGAAAAVGADDDYVYDTDSDEESDGGTSPYKDTAG